jgi:hypothetical protein
MNMILASLYYADSADGSTVRGWVYYVIRDATRVFMKSGSLVRDEYEYHDHSRGNIPN